MNRLVRTKTPAGEDIVILPAAEFERLVDLAEDARDIRDAEKALAEIEAGTVDLLSQSDAQAYLAAPGPLAFWRKHRGLTQAALAKAVGVSQAYMAQIESGKRTADVRVYQRLASQLGVTLDDVVPLEEAPAAKARTSRAASRRARG
jgi:DNA-binding XRE family transcriptional regulator